MRPFERTGEKGTTIVPGGELEIQSLRAEVDAKMQKAARDTQRFNQSPISKKDYGKLTPQAMRGLNSDELQRITPDDIRDMPPALRNALPVDKLNGDQLKALDSALGGRTSSAARRAARADASVVASLDRFGQAVGQRVASELDPTSRVLADLPRRVLSAARRATPAAPLEAPLDHPAALPPGATVALVSTGRSQGAALEIEAIDRTGHPVTVTAPVGLVLEPLEPASARSVAGQVSALADSQAAQGYCLEIHNPPPERGMLYRVADAPLQQKYQGVAGVLRAADSMRASGRLHPDVDPRTYAESITQWAVWSKAERWTQQQFTDEFVNYTKRNMAAANRAWTKQAEDVVRKAAPNRWNDIQSILSEASAGKDGRH